MTPAAGTSLRVRPVQPSDLGPWVAMRSALWPDADVDELNVEARAMLDAGDRAVAFVAECGGALVGLAEASVRHEYVNGTASSPVGFLEGWYVTPAWRAGGVGRALVVAVEGWTRAQGCVELASDAHLDNTGSLAAHAACGFEETERVVYFRKGLG
jgi:aminoglycoside 6'-N-acetyltransferase I